ncbi:MAG: hypothetical protein RLZZ522_1395 [Verrucomicrobiota bacterium]
MKASSVISGTVFTLFGLGFFSAGMLVTWLYFSEIVTWWQVRTWVETPCQIESVKVVPHDESAQTKATYRYVYAGRSYHGDRVGVGRGGDNVGNFQQRTARELKAHVSAETATAEASAEARPFRCFVNPDRPEQAVLYREFRWGLQAMMAAFPLTFPVVGLGVMVAGLMALRTGRAERRLMAAHPAEPWRWQPQWQGPAIPEMMSAWRWALYGFTAWSAMVIFPLLATVVASGDFPTDPKTAFLIGYPLAWAIPAAFSYRRRRKSRLLGMVSFVPGHLPFAPGGMLEGDIVTGKALALRSGAELRLCCERKTTDNRGESSSTATDTVWEERYEIDAGRIASDVSGCRIPARFTLPTDAPETATTKNGATEDKIVWTLTLKLPDLGTGADFELPVFRDPNAPVVAPRPDAPEIARQRQQHLPEMLEKARLVAQFDGREWPRSIYSPPARQRSVMLLLFVFNVIWTGFAVMLVHQHAPLIFRIVWPTTAALIWLHLLWLLLHRRTLTLTDDSLHVLKRLGPAAWRLDLTKDQIAGFSCDSNIQQNNRSLWRVRVKTVIGKQHTLLGGLADRALADALVEAFTRWRG